MRIPERPREHPLDSFPLNALGRRSNVKESATATTPVVRIIVQQRQKSFPPLVLLLEEDATEAATIFEEASDMIRQVRRDRMTHHEARRIHGRRATAQEHDHAFAVGNRQVFGGHNKLAVDVVDGRARAASGGDARRLQEDLERHPICLLHVDCPRLTSRWRWPGGVSR